jgi:hypothetical protein
VRKFQVHGLCGHLPLPEAPLHPFATSKECPKDMQWRQVRFSRCRLSLLRFFGTGSGKESTPTGPIQVPPIKLPC